MFFSNLNYNGLILNRNEGFSLWLAMATSQLSAKKSDSPLGYEPGDLMLIDENTKSDTAVVLFDKTLLVDDGLLEKNAPRLLKLELQDWIENDKFWPKNLDYMTLLSFFDFSFCQTVIYLHEKDETVPNLNQMQGEKYHHQASLHLEPTPAFVDYINQFFTKQKKTAMMYNDHLKNLFDKLKCLFILPLKINSPESETLFIQKQFNLIHQAHLTAILRSVLDGMDDITFDEFSSFYRFHYHSRMTSFI